MDILVFLDFDQSIDVQVVHISSVNQFLLFSHSSSILFDSFLDLGQYIWILDCGRESVLLALDDLPKNISQDLATPGLGQFFNNDYMLERCNGANLLSNERNKFLLDAFRGLPILQDNEPHRDLTFEVIDFGHNGDFRDFGMSQQLFLHLSCGETMASCVDDIVESRHNIKIAIVIEVASISCGVVSRGLLQVLLHKGFVVVVKSQHERRRKGQFYTHLSQFIRRQNMVRVA